MAISDECPARLQLDIRQQLWLESLPQPAHVVGQMYPCALDSGHEGPHAALGQQSGDRAWWLQWTLKASEINLLPECPGTPNGGTDNEDDGVCLLYAGHPGEHLSGDERL